MNFLGMTSRAFIARSRDWIGGSFPSPGIFTVTKKITTATPEQWSEIDRIRQWWIDQQTVQPDDKSVRQVVRDMWRRIPEASDDPVVVVLDSPPATLLGAAILSDSQLSSQLSSQLRSQLDNQLDNQPYLYIWWQAWSGWLEGGKALGVQFDMERYEIFRRWCLSVPFVVAYSGLAIVSRKPSAVHWHDGVLHNEAGPAVEFCDGYGLWSLGGVRVDQQIVETPETQTIDQIRGEDNVEIKRLRIERYGWDKYLSAVGAREIDRRENAIEATREQLLRCDDMTILRAFCPSTGKIFAIEVDPIVENCAQAQNWLWSIEDSETTIVGRT